MERFGYLRGATVVIIGTIKLPVVLVDANSFPAFLPAGKTIPDLSVGMPDEGGPMQVIPNDGFIDLIFNCEGRSKVIKGLSQASYQVIVSGRRDPITQEVTTVFKGKDGDVFLVEEHGKPSVIYLVSKSRVYRCQIWFAKIMFTILGKKLPFTLNKGKLVPEEWRNLK